MTEQTEQESHCTICGSSPAKGVWIGYDYKLCKKCRDDLQYAELVHSPGTTIQQLIEYVKLYMLPYRKEPNENPIP